MGTISVHRRRKVRLLLAEHACTSDLTQEPTAQCKVAKCSDSILELKRHSWIVCDEVVLTTVGVRGAVPTANDGALQERAPLLSGYEGV